MDAVTHLAPTVGVVAACDPWEWPVLPSIGSGRSWAHRPRRSPSWLCRRSGPFPLVLSVRTNEPGY
jgi:hypothetical protein